MTGAMYAAIAGLKAHMQKLNVIGNNTANVNTYGYKSASTGFEESLYTSLKESSAGGNQYGGTNAAQIGYGASVATIQLNMTTGQYAATGINSDIYLSGSGFLMVGDKALNSDGYKSSPEDLLYTRYGRLSIDQDGYLVDYNGRCVYGFLPEGDATGTILTEEDENGMTNYFWDTCLRPIRLPMANLQSTDDGIVEGSAYYPESYGGPPDYDDMDLDEDQVEVATRIKAESVNISVNSSGIVSATNLSTGKSEIVGIIAIAMPANQNGLTKLDGPYYQAIEGGNAGEIAVGTCNQTVSGYLNNVDEADGAELGAIAIVGTGSTQIISSGLELSNTDIATEFADLITTERGFQANTKIITVTDEMLSDLVSMKR